MDASIRRPYKKEVLISLKVTLTSFLEKKIKKTSRSIKKKMNQNSTNRNKKIALFNIIAR
jgi:hypothetical protein